MEIIEREREGSVYVMKYNRESRKTLLSFGVYKLFTLFCLWKKIKTKPSLCLPPREDTERERERERDSLRLQTWSKNRNQSRSRNKTQGTSVEILLIQKKYLIKKKSKKPSVEISQRKPYWMQMQWTMIKKIVLEHETSEVLFLQWNGCYHDLNDATNQDIVLWMAPECCSTSKTEKATVHPKGTQGITKLLFFKARNFLLWTSDTTIQK